MDLSMVIGVAQSVHRGRADSKLRLKAGQIDVS